jgi:hypothetical protein
VQTRFARCAATRFDDNLAITTAARGERGASERRKRCQTDQSKILHGFSFSP